MKLDADNQAYTAFNSIDFQTLIAAAPPGWFTVASWWALEESVALSLLANPLDTLQEEDERLDESRTASDLPEVWVRSCPAFAAQGVAQERAYPEALLLRQYPSNP